MNSKEKRGSFYNEKSETLTMKHKIGYGLGDAGGCMTFALMGALMDKRFAKNRNPKGKFRPWLLRATPMLAISFILLFTIPSLFDRVAAVACLIYQWVLCYRRWRIQMGKGHRCLLPADLVLGLHSVLYGILRLKSEKRWLLIKVKINWGR